MLVVWAVPRRGKGPGNKGGGTTGPDRGGKKEASPDPGAQASIQKQEEAARTVQAPASGHSEAPEKKPEPQPAPAKKATIGIRCERGALAGNSFALSEPVSIGRDRRKCGIIYPEKEPGISAEHVRLTPKGDTLLLEDRGSTHGVTVNGRKIQPWQSVTLKPGDHFCLAGDANRFTVEKK